MKNGDRFDVSSAHNVGPDNFVYGPDQKYSEQEMNKSVIVISLCTEGIRNGEAESLRKPYVVRYLGI